MTALTIDGRFKIMSRDYETEIREILAKDTSDKFDRMDWTWLANHCPAYKDWRKITEDRQASEKQYYDRYQPKRTTNG